MFTKTNYMAMKIVFFIGFLFLICPLRLVAQVICIDSLEAYYPFRKDLSDLSGNEFHGTIPRIVSDYWLDFLGVTLETGTPYKPEIGSRYKPEYKSRLLLHDDILQDAMDYSIIINFAYLEFEESIPAWVKSANLFHQFNQYNVFHDIPNRVSSSLIHVPEYLYVAYRPVEKLIGILYHDQVAYSFPASLEVNVDYQLALVRKGGGSFFVSGWG